MIPSCVGALDGQSGAFVRCTKGTREEFSMIGLVLVTHGRLADEFKAALEHVMGPQKQIEAVTIGAEDDSDLCRSDIIEAVNRVDSGDGVAILTDMFGGTPSNLAISCMSRPKVEVLAGINLPMLVKLAKVREERTLPDAIAMAQEAGRKYVTIASRVLAGK
jgi:PTS system mannose-specific IIA component